MTRWMNAVTGRELVQVARPFGGDWFSLPDDEPKAEVKVAEGLANGSIRKCAVMEYLVGLPADDAVWQKIEGLIQELFAERMKGGQKNEESNRQMTKEEHRKRHIELHGKLDELVTDWILETGGRPSQVTLTDFMIWAYEQTIKESENVGEENL